MSPQEPDAQNNVGPLTHMPTITRISSIDDKYCQSELNEKTPLARQGYGWSKLKENLLVDEYCWSELKRANADQLGLIRVKRPNRRTLRTTSIAGWLRVQTQIAEWLWVSPSWWMTIIGSGPAPIAICKCAFFRWLIGLCPSRRRKSEMQLSWLRI